MRHLFGVAVVLATLIAQSNAEPSARQEPGICGPKSGAARETNAKPATTPEELKAEYDRMLAEVTRRRDETRKEFDEILAGYKAGQRPVADVMRASEEWIKNEGAYHSWVASWVLYSQVKLQDLKDYADSRTFTDVAPGQGVPATYVREYAQTHGVSHEEAKQRIGQGIVEQSVQEHADKYGISIEEARRQMEYYNTHYRLQHGS